jgi:hypothetical protein
MTTNLVKDNVTKLTPRTTKAPRRTPAKPPRPARRDRRQALAGAGVALVAGSLVALSLTHLAHGIEVVTAAPKWEAWSMAVGIDLGFVALEMAQLTAATDAVRRAIEAYVRPAIVGTLAGSAALNAFAFGSAAPGWMLYPAVAIGLAIPALVYALTKIGAVMMLGGKH